MSNSIKIMHKAWLKLKYYTESTEDECGGFIYFKDGIIVDVDLPVQEVTGGSVSFDDKLMIKALTKLAEEDPEKIGLIKGWWHSHNDMTAYFSGVDEDCIQRLLRNQDYVLSIVTAHGNPKEWKAMISFGKEEQFHIEMDLEVMMVDETLREKCKKEIKENCKSFLYAYIPEMFKGRDRKKVKRRTKKKVKRK